MIFSFNFVFYDFLSLFYHFFINFINFLSLFSFNFAFQHPFTEKQLNKLKKLNIIVLKTVKKILACGDEGFGAMESPFEIYSTILTILQ